jgi:toxin-antitoxin system PIN domain toxin
MIAIDTNLLVYAHRAGSPEHRRTQQALERAAAGRWGFATASIAEFYAVVTHPRCEGGPSPPRRAAAFVRALQAAGAETWNPDHDFSAQLLQLAEDLDVAGPRIFDLQIALTAFQAGATELWTHDADFVRIPGLRIVDPIAPR